MTNLILCGGSGTRLWPLSRKLLPKQFVKLFGDRSLFQMTLERNKNKCSNYLIITNNDHYFLALDQAENAGFKNLTMILEPVGRNTAPAIALGCLNLNPDEIVLVTPSDHLIKKSKEYEASLEEAIKLAEKDYLVTFGIHPSYPETGYGYIKYKDHDVVEFKEKPDKKKAEEYILSNEYYWNSGMFCFKAGVYLEELKIHSPEIYEAAKNAWGNSDKEAITRVGIEDMSNIPSDSIDYAVMEKSSSVKVIPCNAGWSDVGSFDSIYDEYDKDNERNAGDKNTISIDSQNNLVIGSGKTVAVVDVENLHIIDTPDALLVAKRGSGQKIKKVVEVLNEKGLQISDTHLTVFRPWGSYTVLEERDGCKIKSIVVKPGKRLSLQKHARRNEHWVVVEGRAAVTLDDKIIELNTNESTYIPKEVLHRLENKEKRDLVIIEVQVGDYLGEDDIVRVEDDFKRA